MIFGRRGGHYRRAGRVELLRSASAAVDAARTKLGKCCYRPCWPPLLCRQIPNYVCYKETDDTPKPVVLCLVIENSLIPRRNQSGCY